MTLNQLYNTAAQQGIEVDYFPMREIVSVSLPAGYVAIDVDKIKSTQDEKYIIAHEAVTKLITAGRRLSYRHYFLRTPVTSFSFL